MPTYEELVRENRELRELVQQQQAQIAELQRVVHEQRQTIALQQQTIARQERRIAELEGQLEELRRRGKRQAAPFSKGDPKAEPKKPGRKPGTSYGRQAVRAVPERVDETVEVGCPVYCPHCSGPVRLEGQDSQYQIDLPPVEPRVTEFVVHWGRCKQCGRRVQGRHPRQVSDAVQVGRVQFGPGVLALTAYLNKVGGLSYGKIAALFGEWMRLSVSRSALCRALGRLANKSQATYRRRSKKRFVPRVAAARIWVGLNPGRMVRVTRLGFSTAERVLERVRACRKAGKGAARRGVAGGARRLD